MDETMKTNQAERQRWNDHAWTEFWPKRERFTNKVTPVLLAALALKRGERVLDIGCGGGLATIEAAGKVGKEGAIVGADISVPLTALASRRAADAGAENISFQVLDVQLDGVQGRPFDVAMSQFGLMFFDEPRVAFNNIRRHLVAGGRLGFACWQAAEKNPWIFTSALAGIAPPPPPPLPGKSPTGPFTLADAELVRRILAAAGFVGISLATHDIEIEVPEDALVDDAQLVLMGVPIDKMAEARTAVGRHLAPFRQPSGMSRFPLAFQVVTAQTS